MGDGKSVLVIEDDDCVMDLVYSEILKLGHTITELLYKRGQEPAIPEGRFDYLVIDGLDGEWKAVGERVNADTKVLVSNDYDLVSEVQGGDGKWKAVHKADLSSGGLVEVLV